MRAVSTVLDVTLFLLLVSVAVVTLAVPAADPPASTADETAETLAASTTNVTYSVAPIGRHGGSERTAVGTTAALLGRGAVATVALGGERVTPHTDGFRSAVTAHAESALAWSPDETSVVAVWEPYPDAPLRGRLAAGVQPPSGVEVSTATLTVPAPIPPVAPDAPANASGTDGAAGFRALGREISRTVLGATVAANGSDRGHAPDQARRDRRLQAFAGVLGVDGASPTLPAVTATDEWRSRTYRAVERRLAGRLAADMHERYDSAAAAAADVRTGTVRVVVREWST